jgi:hypothetical protein
MIMSIMTVSASLMRTEKVPHEMPDACGQVSACSLPVGHPP